MNILLLKYVALADRATGNLDDASKDALVQSCYNNFKPVTPALNELDRILSLTPSQAKAELIAITPKDEKETKFKEELCKKFDITKGNQSASETSHVSSSRRQDIEPTRRSIHEDHVESLRVAFRRIQRSVKDL